MGDGVPEMDVSAERNMREVHVVDDATLRRRCRGDDAEETDIIILQPVPGDVVRRVVKPEYELGPLIRIRRVLFRKGDSFAVHVGA